MPYDGKKSPAIAIIGVTSKMAPNANAIPLKISIFLPLVKKQSLWFITLDSNGAKIREIPFKIDSISFFDIL